MIPSLLCSFYYYLLLSQTPIEEKIAKEFTECVISSILFIPDYTLSHLFKVVTCFLCIHPVTFLSDLNLFSCAAIRQVETNTLSRQLLVMLFQHLVYIALYNAVLFVIALV